MERFNSLMVALDNTIFDRELIGFTAYFTQLAHTEKVYFVHVDRDLEIPDHLLLAYEAKNSLPKDEQLKNELAQRVNRYFKNRNDLAVEILVKEGKTYHELLHLSRIKKVDLLVVGHKKLSEGSGVTANKLVRHTQCSVLVVPPGQKFPFQHTIVPFDFSAASDRALKTALQISQENHLGEIEAIHIFDVPIMSRYEANMDFSELSAKVEQYKAEMFKDYLHKEGLGKAAINLKLIQNKHGKTAHYLDKSIKEMKDSLVVMGATGKSLMSFLLLGSVTERLLTLNKQLPILVIRKATA